MERIITDDGSITFYNEQVGDHYHTKSGAREEAIEKHVKALGMVPGKVVYDICFGLGYNAAAALEIGPATIYCFENDAAILEKIMEIDAPFESYPLIQSFIRSFLAGNEKFADGKTTLRMLFGDARKRMRDATLNADFVFFDPFSPAKVPELWTADFFADIRGKMNPGAKLSTYSCARWVRENMRRAGFTVLDGPIIGRRSPSTVCVNGC